MSEPTAPAPNVDAPNVEAVAAIAAAPMGSWLGFEAREDGDGSVFRLGFSEEHIGNPLIRALHGGVIAAFLEYAMQAELAARLETGARIAAIDVATDYLASSRDADMLARVRVLRIGRRVAFLEAAGWQDTEDKPVAVARAAFRIHRTPESRAPE